jgi:thioredoxin-dependent peroxiredoxin
VNSYFILRSKAYYKTYLPVQNIYQKSSGYCILLLLSLAGSCQAPKSKELTVGDTIPAFSLPDQDGKIFNSADHIGKTSLVIFFYPKDESMVCTKEACGFRDRYADLTRAGALVIGINGGSIDSHKKFQTNDKLPYPLLSDSANKVLNAFGVPKQFFMTGRKTFVVDKTGRIVFTYNSSLRGSKHAEEALAYLKKLKGPS